MDQHYDTIVIGLGGVGSATAYHLANSGHRVLGIDQFEPAHSRGSSHGETRAIRQAYFEHPDYVPLATQSYHLWRDLERKVNASLLTECGLLQVGPKDGEVIHGVQLAAQTHGLNIHELPAAQINTRFAPLRGDDSSMGLFEECGGYLRVESCVECYLSVARSAGADLMHQTEVLDWNADSSIRVRTRTGEFRSDKLVIAPGAAAAALCRLPYDFEVLQKHQYWFDLGSATQSPALPVFLFETPRGIFYGFPSVDGQTVKVAQHTGGRTYQADGFPTDTSMDQEDLQLVHWFLETYLGARAPQPVRHQVCWYTMSPDGNFCVGSHPDFENVWVGCGFSGHGFKFCSVIGRALCDCVVDGGTATPIGFLDPGRF